MSDFINTIDVLGDDELTDRMINRTITEYKDDAIEQVGQFAFSFCTALESVDLPNVTSLHTAAFGNCSALTSIRLPAAKVIGVNSNYGYVFQKCTSLSVVDLPAATQIAMKCFTRCSALTALALRRPGLCSLSDADALEYTPIPSGFGYILVPEVLIDSYKSATNWTAYASSLRALEDFTVDGTTTGDLTIHRVSWLYTDVISDNSGMIAGRAYHATLTSHSGSPVDATVTMGGIDVTADVYDPASGTINIAAVTGDISIMASGLYVPVSYVGANGTQYIDLGVALTEDMAIEVDASFDSSENGQVMGTIAPGDDGMALRAHFGVFSEQFDINGQRTAAFDTERHTYYMSGNSAFFDGKKTVSNPGYKRVPVGTNFWLFYRNTNSGSYSQMFCFAKVYSAKFYESETLTHDFVPVVRKEDGVAGMYDRINHVFVTNAGTGSLFTDLQTEEE